MDCQAERRIERALAIARDPIPMGQSEFCCCANIEYGRILGVGVGWGLDHDVDASISIVKKYLWGLCEGKIAPGILEEEGWNFP